jgi:hypothetical protein
MEIPNNVFDAYDGRATIFISQPENYKENDLWILSEKTTINEKEYPKGYILTAKNDGSTYNSKDWEEKIKYTNDDAANNAQNTADNAQNAANNAQNAADNAQNTANGALDVANGALDAANKAQTTASAAVPADVTGTYSWLFDKTTGLKIWNGTRTKENIIFQITDGSLWMKGTGSFTGELHAG